MSILRSLRSSLLLATLVAGCGGEALLPPDESDGTRVAATGNPCPDPTIDCTNPNGTAVYTDSDGSALIEQYNAMGDRSYSVLRMTAPRYLF